MTDVADPRRLVHELEKERGIARVQVTHEHPFGSCHLHVGSLQDFRPDVSAFMDASAIAPKRCCAT
jgi:hypothetical protein